MIEGRRNAFDQAAHDAGLVSPTVWFLSWEKFLPGGPEDEQVFLRFCARIWTKLVLPPYMAVLKGGYPPHTRENRGLSKIEFLVRHGFREEIHHHHPRQNQNDANQRGQVNALPVKQPPNQRNQHQANA